jgi:hypothetical protein
MPMGWPGMPGRCCCGPATLDRIPFADHAAVLGAALRQIPARMRSRLLVRVDGAGASHELITHLLSLSSRRRTVLFTCGWAITEADEQAIRLLPAAAAWQAAVDQDGVVQEDKHVAEITHLTSRAGRWPAGLRWIVRRTKPSRRQARNLTARLVRHARTRVLKISRTWPWKEAFLACWRRLCALPAPA